jgi:retron-type reverse transcriptase
VFGITWREYEAGLEGRLVDLHSRIHRGAYRAQPSRRVCIPKSDGRQRRFRCCLPIIYLHYVYDLWVNAWRKKHAEGVQRLMLAAPSMTGTAY